MVGDAKPYRTFRWYLGQMHYSGSYWSSTESAHVIYESRLELSRLLMPDFDEQSASTLASGLASAQRMSPKDRRFARNAGVNVCCGAGCGRSKAALIGKPRFVEATLIGASISGRPVGRGRRGSSQPTRSPCG